MGSERLSRRGFVGLVGAAAIAPRPAGETTGNPPEVIYHNGVLVTMEERRPRAEALAIRAGLILAVGDNKTVWGAARGAERPFGTIVDVAGYRSGRRQIMVRPASWRGGPGDR